VGLAWVIFVQEPRVAGCLPQREGRSHQLPSAARRANFRLFTPFRVGKVHFRGPRGYGDGGAILYTAQRFSQQHGPKRDKPGCAVPWHARLQQWDNRAMNAPKTVSPRARMQELLAIPDSQRSDAEWDELNELEIMFAPGNRLGTPDRSGAGGEQRNGGGQQRNGGGQQRRKSGGPRPPQGQGGGNAPQMGANPQGGDAGAGAKKPVRKFRKKPPRNKEGAPDA